jgi:putative transposase
VEHYHQERNHQGKDNLLLFPVSVSGTPASQGVIRRRERLGGLLNYYDRVA